MYCQARRKQLQIGGGHTLQIGGHTLQIGGGAHIIFFIFFFIFIFFFWGGGGIFVQIIGGGARPPVPPPYSYGPDCVTLRTCAYFYMYMNNCHIYGWIGRRTDGRTDGGRAFGRAEDGWMLSSAAPFV